MKRAKTNDKYQDKYHTTHTPTGKLRRFQNRNRQVRALTIYRKYNRGWRTVAQLAQDYALTKQAVHQIILKVRTLRAAGEL